MVKVVCRSGPRAWSVTAKGHATGSPELCAAVSALMYALAGFVRNSGVDSRVRLTSGDAVVRSRTVPGDAYRMAVIGFLQLEKSYPELLRVES